MPSRTRIAPSPTGYFHVGTARNALYNWLVARQDGGTYVLRIEDTDAERNQEEWVDGIGEAMRWLELDWDEYERQSERFGLYAAAAEKLVAAGRAYFCECTRDQVDARRPEGAPSGYDGFCRDRGLEAGEGRALRFRTPDEGSTVVVDVVRGEPVFPNHTIEDFVIQRSDGSPIFILANVVDDIDMRITHVIRSEEHLPNTPKYQLLWEALDGGPLPVFAHLPLLVNEKRHKISKRRDPVALEQYRAEGYLPEAMCNYLALLGWAPGGDREFVTREELLAEFRLDAVNNSPAFFDVKKLRHFNAEYIRRLSVDAFVDRAAAYLPDAWDVERLRPLAELVQTRVEVLSEVAPMVAFLFEEPEADDAEWEKGVVKHGEAGRQILDGVIDGYEGCVWNAGVLHELTQAVGERAGLKLGKAQAPVRVAVTGRTTGPPLFESLEALGRDVVLGRLRRARERLG